MITNIIDRRKFPYRWLTVDAVVEPTQHDNSIENADQAEKKHPEWIGCGELEHATVEKAVKWAMNHSENVTLYLYDHVEDNNVRKSPG